VANSAQDASLLLASVSGVGYRPDWNCLCDLLLSLICELRFVGVLAGCCKTQFRLIYRMPFVTLPVRLAEEKISIGMYGPLKDIMLTNFPSFIFRIEFVHQFETVVLKLNGLHDEIIEVMKFSEDEGAAEQVGGLGETKPKPTPDEENWQVII
jgi:hypothetical protein